MSERIKITESGRYMYPVTITSENKLFNISKSIEEIFDLGDKFYCNYSKCHDIFMQSETELYALIEFTVWELAYIHDNVDSPDIAPVEEVDPAE